jgi:hypothetical protein
MARKRIGEILLEKGVISRHQLEAALMIQKQSKARLGITLVSQNFITEEALMAALSDALHVPAVTLKNLSVDWSAVHMLRPRFCEVNEVFPFAIEGKGTAKKALLVAMADPLNAPAIQEIEFTTGLPVSPRIATVSEVRSSILRYYYKVDPNTAPEGKMALVSRGGGTRLVDTETGASAEEPDVVMGEVLPDDPSDTLDQLIGKKQQGTRKKDGVAKDLDFLFGQTEGTEVEKLERKLWALIRIMARKGLITKDEFHQELDESEE